MNTTTQGKRGDYNQLPDAQMQAFIADNKGIPVEHLGFEVSPEGITFWDERTGEPVVTSLFGQDKHGQYADVSARFGDEFIGKRVYLTDDFEGDAQSVHQAMRSVYNTIRVRAEGGAA